MVNPEKHRSVDDRETEATDQVDRTVDEGFDDSSDGEAIGTENSANSGLTERLTDILIDEGDGDLLLQESDRGDRILQFLQALDFQVMGACRADERLKPLLKLNVSSGAAEDRLLAHLSQHFEPSEVGMLARCLCIPLVTVRVGKINKQGTLLCPTATRGNLNLTLLPASDLRMSFIGDDGHTERLLTLSRDSECSAVALEEIPADKSGLSFQIKTLDEKVFYFWCSEKSKLLGNELITKMKDLLKRKPSLAELTGISESRLDCFATHLRAYLVGSSVSNRRPSSIVALTPSSETNSYSSELRQTAQSSLTSSKPLRSRHIGSQSGKSNSLYQGSLSPRSSSFKEGFPRILSSLRSVTREKLRRGDSPFSVVNHLSIASAVTTDASSLNHSGKDKLQEATEVCFLPPNLFESLGRSAAPPFLSPVSHVPLVGSSLFSPYYCLCPLIASSCQYTMTSPQLPISSTESFSLPPLSSLLQAAKSSSGLMPIPPLNVADIPPLDFPPMLPDPLVRLQLPRSSSQQIPTFIPLMCDPIVHIPVIDVCSSGQGYLVSAGPAISTTIPPLHPLIPETASVVEQSARETLRMLINSSSHTNQQLMDVLPSVLSNTDDKQNVFSLGSRGLYSGGRDVGAIANSIAAMGLVSLSEKSVGGTAARRCFGRDNLEDQLEKPGGGGFGGSYPNDDGGGSVTQVKEERND